MMRIGKIQGKSVLIVLMYVIAFISKCFACTCRFTMFYTIIMFYMIFMKCYSYKNVIMCVVDIMSFEHDIN